MPGYKGLKVWQLGLDIAVAVYEATEHFPGHEVYGLSSQLRRAAVSVPSNIAEGHSRGATKDWIRFLAVSRGSIAERETQLMLAKRLGYIDNHRFEHLSSMLEEESRMISGLRRTLRSKLPK